MTRPARPGDICIVINDPENMGKNVGKQLHCDQQCRCDANSWVCTTLEPFVQLAFFHQIRHAPGAVVCCRKQDIIPLLDPDPVPGLELPVETSS